MIENHFERNFSENEGFCKIDSQKRERKNKGWDNKEEEKDKQWRKKRKEKYPMIEKKGM